jgi:hypothetical protein
MVGGRFRVIRACMDRDYSRAELWDPAFFLREFFLSVPHL